MIEKTRGRGDLDRSFAMSSEIAVFSLTNY
jgi:hypothetical protein